MRDLLYKEDMVMSLSVNYFDLLNYMDQELDEIKVLSNAPLPWWHKDMLLDDSI